MCTSWMKRISYLSINWKYDKINAADEGPCKHLGRLKLRFRFVLNKIALDIDW